MIHIEHKIHPTKKHITVVIIRLTNELVEYYYLKDEKHKPSLKVVPVQVFNSWFFNREQINNNQLDFWS